MTGRITANLPSRSFDDTERFYAALGFERAFRDEDWMILARGPLEIEFFPHPELDPATSWFGACVRVDDVDALHGAWGRAGVPADGVPRLTAPRDEPFGFRMFALIDPDGSLLRCLSPLRATRQIRPATPDDVPAIEACARAAYAPYVPRIGREPAPMVADFRSAVAAGRVQVLGEDDALLGYVVAYADGNATKLENIAILPGCTGRGHGRALIDFVEAEALRRGHEAMTLYTNVAMVENLALYPHLGYVETDRRHEDGHDRVYFSKALC